MDIGLILKSGHARRISFSIDETGPEALVEVTADRNDETCELLGMVELRTLLNMARAIVGLWHR